MPAVSVVLNCYNHERYVGEAVASVLAQTFSDFELVAIDNGSTDGTPDVLRTFANDERVRLLLHPANEAISKRLNEGVAAARGEFISFLYSDDFYVPTKLECQIAELRERDESYGVVYGPAYGQNELTGARWLYPSIAASGDVFEAFMTRHQVGQVDMISPLTRRACLLRHRFHEDIFSEGESIFLRVALTHKFVFLAEPLAVIRDHGANAGKAIKRNCEFTRAALRKLREEPGLTDRQRTLIDRYEGILLRGYGWQGMRVADDPRWARACFRAAMGLSVRHVAHPKVGAAIGLMLLPRRMRQSVNRVGHALRRSPGNPQYVEEYEGLSRPAR
jgi:glycosyltransferase involved in cell wall biosynthesis